MFGRGGRSMFDYDPSSDYNQSYSYNPLPVSPVAVGYLSDWYGGDNPLFQMNSYRPRRQPICTLDSRNDLEKFQVMLNVKHFKPEEIDVKTVDNFVVIHGKHEEQADEHGLISREFTRRYQLPEDVEPETVTSSLSQDGVLTILAPKKLLEPPPKNERVVPIIIQQPASATALEEAQKAHLHHIQEVQKQDMVAAAAAQAAAEEQKQ